MTNDIGTWGTSDVAPGHRKRLRLEIGKSFSGANITLPLMVWRGSGGWSGRRHHRRRAWRRDQRNRRDPPTHQGTAVHPETRHVDPRAGHQHHGLRAPQPLHAGPPRPEPMLPRQQERQPQREAGEGDLRRGGGQVRLPHRPPHRGRSKDEFPQRASELRRSGMREAGPRVRLRGDRQRHRTRRLAAQGGEQARLPEHRSRGRRGLESRTRRAGTHLARHFQRPVGTRHDRRIRTSRPTTRSSSGKPAGSVRKAADSSSSTSLREMRSRSARPSRPAPVC